MYTPDFETFMGRAREGNLVPVYREILADMETPVSAFLKLRAAGNGYAFLKLYERTGDATWLERARAFAMHGIAQTAGEWAQHGQGQYSLWTGDLGFAVYLWDCLTGRPRFPTLDVFFAPPALAPDAR
mgnify:CR=1 FL=1